MERQFVAFREVHKDRVRPRGQHQRRADTDVPSREEPRRSRATEREELVRERVFKISFSDLLRAILTPFHSHIFYQLCFGLSEDAKRELRIESADKYDMLKQSGCTTIEDVNDAEQFRRTTEALTTGKTIRNIAGDQIFLIDDSSRNNSRGTAEHMARPLRHPPAR